MKIGSKPKLVLTRSAYSRKVVSYMSEANTDNQTCEHPNPGDPPNEEVMSSISLRERLRDAHRSEIEHGPLDAWNESDARNLPLPQPQRSEQQEWTEKDVRELFCRSARNPYGVIADAINAALAVAVESAVVHPAELITKMVKLGQQLAAERRLRDEARAQRAWLIKECQRVGVTVGVQIGAPITEAYLLHNERAENEAKLRQEYHRKIQSLTEELEHSKSVSQSWFDKYRSALAAIENHNMEASAEVSEASCYVIEVDRSALDKHDDGVRKPLVETLTLIVNRCKGCGDYYRSAVQDVIRRGADALANVKEGK